MRIAARRGALRGGVLDEGKHCLDHEKRVARARRVIRV